LVERPSETHSHLGFRHINFKGPICCFLPSEPPCNNQDNGNMDSTGNEGDISRCFLKIQQLKLHQVTLHCPNMSPAAAAATPRVPNPHQKRAQNAADVGRQSQQRVSNQTKRKFQLAAKSPRQRDSNSRPWITKLLLNPLETALSAKQQRFSGTCHCAGSPNGHTTCFVF